MTAQLALERALLANEYVGDDPAVTEAQDNLRAAEEALTAAQNAARIRMDESDRRRARVRKLEEDLARLVQQV